MGVYSVRDAARILKVKPARLRYWKRTQLVRSRDDSSPEGRNRDDGADPEEGFEFQDLVCVRAVLALLEGGVPLQRIRQSVEILRESVPELHEPLSALRVWGEASSRMVVRHDGHLLEPDGQLVLEFEDSDAAEGDADISALPRPEPSKPLVGHADDAKAGEPSSELAALDWFEIGCGLDSDPATYERAIVAYRNAVSLDGDFADAHCNLGAALYNHGARAEARACFESCLRLQPTHVEGRFNLANLLDEEGESEAALDHYLEALRGDPFYADLHINLALLYEKLGRTEEGRQHWRRYLQIEPAGGLADIARQRIKD